MAGRRWTTPRGPENRFPFKKENVHRFLQYSGACCCRHNARQSYNPGHILDNFSSDSTSVSNPVTSRQCSCSQSSHHTDVPRLSKKSFVGFHMARDEASLRGTLMTMVSVWWNIHHSHLTWRRAISGSFQNSNLPLLGNVFQWPKTLVKLCILIWGP